MIYHVYVWGVAGTIIQLHFRGRYRSGELGVRLGGLEMQGLVKTLSEMDVEGSSLPNGITAAGLTSLGKRALSGPRW